MSRRISFENTFVDVPPGTPDFFKVEIIHTEATQTQRGSDRIRFKARVISGLRTEEAHRYCTIREGFNLPRTEKQVKYDVEHNDDTQDKRDMDEMMGRMWMSFFVSVGYSQDEVRSKGFDFDNVNEKGSFEYLIGRLGYVKYTPADPDSGQKYDKKQWLTEDQWEMYGAAAATKHSLAASAVIHEKDPLDAILGSK
jgi:hypothetical protein